MTVWLKYKGCFQCRLPTDPDPSDEPRGVSGYVHAIAGEPDLDRIIRLQSARTTQRSHCPEVSVTVAAVYGDPSCPPEKHPIVGATVELLDNPMFEGRNHILAQDGVEAVVPVHIQIKKGKFLLRRKFDDTMKFPPFTDDDRQKFAQLQATGINMSPGAIGEETGIFDLKPVWADRVVKLKADLAANPDPTTKAALLARIEGMANPFNARFYGARMLYAMSLGGSAEVTDPEGYLPGKAAVGAETPWPLEFWYGAWDPDALCGFMVGFLGVAIEPQGARAETTTKDIASAMANPSQRRR